MADIAFHALENETIISWYEFLSYWQWVSCQAFAWTCFKSFFKYWFVIPLLGIRGRDAGSFLFKLKWLNCWPSRGNRIIGMNIIYALRLCFVCQITAWYGWLILALIFELSKVLLNPILLSLCVRAKAVMIQNGSQACDSAPYDQNEKSSTCS